MENQCKRCQGERVVKNGHSRHGHQRFKCVSCGLSFGQLDHRRVDPQRRESALKHYAEGTGLRTTERLVGVSHNSVMNWVRQEVAGKAIERLDPAQIDTIEADELWTYVGSKKTQFGSGGLLIALPKAYSAGRWVIATPARPERWARRFLAALASLTPPTTGSATAKSSPKPSTFKAKRTPTTSKA
jgi:transposase-like protein